MLNLLPQPDTTPGEDAFHERAHSDVQAFLRANPLVARTPHSAPILQALAMLVWERGRARAGWSELSISEFFRRLRVEQSFVVTPEKVVTSYDILHFFVPWLLETQRIGPGAADRLWEELLCARKPLVAEAQRLLRLRKAGLTRHGAWHEVLKTMGGP